MKWSDEHYRLVLTPRYVRIDKTKIFVDCWHCQGRGSILDQEDLYPKKCERCDGGKIEQLKPIPSPPEIDKKFLQDLQDWINNYKEE